jgi:uncharacterized membrane protein YuzA (DUF378 family)
MFTNGGNTMKKTVDYIVTGLLIIAGINWALWGIWEFNLISYVFGETWIDCFLYFLMGVAGLYAAVAWRVFRFGLFKRPKAK